MNSTTGKFEQLFCVCKSKLQITITTSIAVLCLTSCSGYTPNGRLATREESIRFFSEHRREFETLRDMLISDPNKNFAVFGAEDFSCYDCKYKVSATQLSSYAEKLHKLQLVSISKSVRNTRGKPVPELIFNLSALGIAGNGSSRSIVFCENLMVSDPENFSKITGGWYLLEDLNK